jgi:hypothetical protein
MYGLSEFVDAGGLMFYGASLTEMYRRAATWIRFSKVPSRLIYP